MDREKLKNELRRDEGLRLEAYTCCTGHRTIGYGHLIDNLPHIKTITLDEAERLLDLDIAIAKRVAERFVAPLRLLQLSEPRQRAIMNMAFNLGNRLMGFKRLRIAIHKGDWQEAANEALDSLWAKQVGARAIRISRMLEQGYGEEE